MPHGIFFQPDSSQPGTHLGMHRKRPVLACIASIALLAACDGRVLLESTTELLGANGGITRSAAGRLELRVPAGTLTTQMEITIETFRDRQLPGLRSPVFRVTPQGLAFGSPVSVRYLQDPDAAVFAELRMIDAVGSTHVIPECGYTQGAFRCPSVTQSELEIALFTTTIQTGTSSQSLTQQAPDLF